MKQDPEKKQLIKDTIELEYRKLGPIRYRVYLLLKTYSMHIQNSHFQCAPFLFTIQLCQFSEFLSFLCAVSLLLRFAEVAAAFMFVVLIILWFFRAPGFMEGWGDQLKDG